MDFLTILKTGWRITWKQWRLWALTLVMFVAFLPALLIAGSFGSLAGLIAGPPEGPQWDWLLPLTGMSGWMWGVFFSAVLATLLVTTAVSWVLQVAAMRGAAAAAESGGFTLGEALSLGRQRFNSIITLTLVFGAIMAALALLPPVLTLVMPAGQFSSALASLLNAGLAPVNSVLGIALLLVMMSVALEDKRPKAAVGRAWSVFKSGWRQFLVIIGLSVASGIVVALLTIPLATVAALVVLFEQSWLLLLGCAGVTLPFMLFVTLFTAVFTLVLYTLAYRARA